MKVVRLVLGSAGAVLLLALAFARPVPASVPGRADPLSTMRAVQTETAAEVTPSATTREPAEANQGDLEATVSALQTRVAELEGEMTAIATGSATSTSRPKTPTPRPRVPTPTPTPTFDEIVTDYPPIADIRELAIRPGSLVGDQLAFSGTVLTIGVAAPGRVFILGGDEPAEYASQLQVTVLAPDGSTEVVLASYDGDTEGVFEGTYVTVYGTVVDTHTFENALGGTITQPLVAAELVVIA